METWVLEHPNYISVFQVKGRDYLVAFYLIWMELGGIDETADWDFGETDRLAMQTEYL